jgi:DNA-binding NtrC family response regulator
MLHYTWPGNIRELRNAIERAVLLAGNGPLMREHFAVEKMTATVSTPLAHTTPLGGIPASGIEVMLHGHASSSGTSAGKETLIPPNGETTQSASLGERLRQQVKEVERQHILDALTRCGGNQTRAAKELGISRRTLISRLEEYNIPRPLKDRRFE